MRTALLCALCLLASVPLADAASPWMAFEAPVARIADGDTLSFTGRREVCRLTGIDAPETAKKGRHEGQPGGDAAREFLTRMVGTRPVTVLAYGADHYGRLLCWVLTPGALAVNLELVRFGHAEVYVYEVASPPPFLPALRQVEVEAKAARRGVWAQERYESPAAFRQRMRRGADQENQP